MGWIFISNRIESEMPTYCKWMLSCLQFSWGNANILVNTLKGWMVGIWRWLNLPRLWSGLLLGFELGFRVRCRVRFSFTLPIMPTTYSLQCACRTAVTPHPIVRCTTHAQRFTIKIRLLDICIALVQLGSG